MSADDPSGKHPLMLWWAREVTAKVEHEAVVERVKADGGWNGHYAFMTVMSAGIAVLGLLLSSPAVVIGAMLISPLMGPILALGFGLATFDFEEIRRSLVALGLGILLAVAFCALIVVLSPLQTVTDEIAARTRPNLFDLLVALFSGLAGAYAMIRGRQGAIVGVAIATAIMPPLATVGFGLATGNWTVFWGAALLFFTNLMVIALAGAIMARFYRFGHDLSPRQTRLQASLIVVTLLALGVPLGLTLKSIAWEALASRQSGEIIMAQFNRQARLSGIEIDYHERPILIEAAVLTPAVREDAERQATLALTRVLGQPVEVTIDQLRVGSGQTEARQIAAARGDSTGVVASRVAERLALAAGVSPGNVIVDRSQRRAVVRAVPLPGADLSSYRALEERVAATERNWDVLMMPPPTSGFPQVTFDDEGLDAAGTEAVASAAWAGTRLSLTIGIVGGTTEQAEAVLAALEEAGAAAEIGEREGPLELEWIAPRPGR